MESSVAPSGLGEADGVVRSKSSLGASNTTRAFEARTMSKMLDYAKSPYAKDYGYKHLAEIPVNKGWQVHGYEEVAGYGTHTVNVRGLNGALRGPITFTPLP